MIGNMDLSTTRLTKLLSKDLLIDSIVLDDC